MIKCNLDNIAEWKSTVRTINSCEEECYERLDNILKRRKISQEDYSKSKEIFGDIHMRLREQARKNYLSRRKLLWRGL